MSRAQHDQEFSAFVRERSPRLQLLARHLCGDPHIAEDLTQTVLEKAYLKWGRVRQADDPAAYVRRMLVNLNIDRQRRRGWREQPTSFDADESSYAAAAAHRLGSGDRTDHVADQDAVRRMLAGLTAKERAVVVLRFLEDLSEADTAAELGIKLGTVKSTCSRALGKLRAAAAETRTEEPR